MKKICIFCLVFCLVFCFASLTSFADERNNPLEVLTWEKENGDLNKLAISLRNDSNSTKPNKNIYPLGETITYYIDIKNGGQGITNTVTVHLQLPINFKTVDVGEGKVESQDIIWTYPTGIPSGYSGTIVAKIKYTSLANQSVQADKIYPSAKIVVNDAVVDNSTVINFIFNEYNSIIKETHEPYMHGDAYWGTFRPDDTINRAEGALVLARILLGQDIIDKTIVTDVFPDIDDVYLEAQKAIVATSYFGIINGYSDGTYKPTKIMTRAEFMKILAKFIEIDSKEKQIEGLEIKDISKTIKLYKNPVTEYVVNGNVITNHWAIKEVSFLSRLNMTPLRENELDLRLDDGITRAEVTQLVNFYLLRAPARIKSGKTGFSDVSKDHKLVGDIVEATRESHEYIINSSGNEVAK